MPNHAITNRKIIDTLREIALYLRAQEIPFKPQAYETAAEGIASLQDELKDMFSRCGKKCIEEIPGVGASIAEKIEELINTGKLEYYKELKKKYPFDMFSLTQIQDVGPKTALKLYKRLRIKTVNDLERAALTGKIAKMPSMGKKSQDNILRGVHYLKGTAGRQLIHDVLPFATRITDKLKRIDGVNHVDIAGSLRRRKETIGDIDLIATSSNPSALIRFFKTIPEVAMVLEEGRMRVMARYTSGLNGDLLILPPAQYGAALLHFTGSREHNILLRERAIKKGLKLSEHGLFKNGKLLASRFEEDVYQALELQFIPPELRVGADEIAIAAKNKIPTLIPYGSLKGDMQIQSNWSDGTSSIEEMARTAKTYGLSYIAVTDHTKSLHIAGGLNEKQLTMQTKEIDALNKKLRGFKILKSTECEIREDGSLDLNDSVLKTLDVVSIAVHGRTNMDRNTMTERIIRALKHPLVNILFHPTGRVVTKRDGYDLEMDRVIRAAKQYKVALEINGSARLDLHEQYIREAVNNGAKLIISSDAHDPSHYVNLEHGVAQARKGWARKADILNTKPLKRFLAAIKK